MRITSPYLNIHSQESMSVIAIIHVLTIPIIHVLTLTIIHVPTLPIIHVPALPINRLLREQYSLFHISRTGIQVGCLFSLFNQSQEQFFLQKCHLLKMLLGAQLGEASRVAPRVEPPTNQAFRHSNSPGIPELFIFFETSRTPAEARTVSAICCYIFSSG